MSKASKILESIKKLPIKSRKINEEGMDCYQEDDGWYCTDAEGVKQGPFETEEEAKNSCC